MKDSVSIVSIVVASALAITLLSGSGCARKKEEKKSNTVRLPLKPPQNPNKTQRTGNNIEGEWELVSVKTQTTVTEWETLRQIKERGAKIHLSIKEHDPQKNFRGSLLFTKPMNESESCQVTLTLEGSYCCDEMHKVTFDSPLNSPIQESPLGCAQTTLGITPQELEKSFYPLSWDSTAYHFIFDEQNLKLIGPYDGAKPQSEVDLFFKPAGT